MADRGYGSRDVGPHDLTGRNFRRGLDEKAGREEAIRRTISQVGSGEDIELVTLPGGGATYAIPKIVARHLRGGLNPVRPAVGHVE